MLKIRGIWQITKSVIRFSEILCNDRHSKVSKNVFFFCSFFMTILSKEPLWTLLNTKLTCLIFIGSLFCFS